MANLRTGIKKIEENGTNKENPDLYAQTNFLIEGVLNALKEQKYMFNFICVKRLVFIQTGDEIHVKGSINHSSDLFKIANKNSSKILKVLKARLKSENYQIYDEEENFFAINLD